MEPNSPFSGLTKAEAERLREMGGGNTPPPSITKSTRQIIREHVCTLFNLFNVLIAIALALVGAWSNLLFILIIALNTIGAGRITTQSSEKLCKAQSGRISSQKIPPTK